MFSGKVSERNCEAEVGVIINRVDNANKDTL